MRYLYFNWKYKGLELLSRCVCSACFDYSVDFPSLGEHQQPHFPGLTRGLVAVLLYWDGKRCIANSLRTLIQSRQGKTWTLELRSVSGRWVDQSSLFWVLLGLIRLEGICIVSSLLVSHNLMQLLSCLFLKHNHFLHIFLLDYKDVYFTFISFMLLHLLKVFCFRHSPSHCCSN